MKKGLKQPLIIDGRNLYDPAVMLEQGFTYDCIGRPSVGTHHEIANAKAS